jgi:hypothetical protein
MMNKFTAIPLTPDPVPPVTTREKMAADLIKAGCILINDLTRLVLSLERPLLGFTVRDSDKTGVGLDRPAVDVAGDPVPQTPPKFKLDESCPAVYPAPLVGVPPEPTAVVHPEAPRSAAVQKACQVFAELGIPVGLKFRADPARPAGKSHLIPVVVFPNHRLTQMVYNLLCHADLLGQTRFDVSWNRDPAAPPATVPGDVVNRYNLLIIGNLPPNQE